LDLAAQVDHAHARSAATVLQRRTPGYALSTSAGQPPIGAFDMRTVRRITVLIAGVLGLLAASGSAAQAIHVVGNHCEPVRRS